MTQRSAAVRKPEQNLPERRSSRRERIVLRVGVLTDESGACFCLVKNISQSGAKVKLYGPATVGSAVELRMGDESPLAGRIVWARDGLAGIDFDGAVEPEMVLRAAHKLAPTKRRSSPRVRAAGQVLLRSGGQIHAAALCDISTSGAKIRTSKLLEFGPSLAITLRGFPPMKAYVRWMDDAHVGLVFDDHIPVELLSEWLAEQPEVSA
jgi:hypothetical protein